jgi:ubiquinone/menaquinone biosynthesis C-methylase UbiE
MSARDNADDVVRHYGGRNLRQEIERSMRQAGWLDKPLAAADLAAFDQFHTLGTIATRELAALLPLGPGTRVLDVGGGLGGPARLIASECGCDVTVLDLTPDFCETGLWLTTLTGLEERVHFQLGSALALAFPGASFDVVWTQHAAMNIPDRDGLYRGIHRVLRPGGLLAVHDVLAGSVQPLHYPVPWASTQAMSFLLDAAGMRAQLSGAGFEELHWEDATDRAVKWFQDRPARAAASPLSLRLIVGDGYETAYSNQARNLAEGRARVVRTVWRRAL